MGFGSRMNANLHELETGSNAWKKWMKIFQTLEKRAGFRFSVFRVGGFDVGSATCAGVCG